MSLVCQVCSQHPFPALQTWQEQINKQLKTFHNACTAESQQFRLIADGIAAYIELLRTEQAAATKALVSALSFVTPILKIPDDVLVYIFRYTFSPSFNWGEPFKVSEIQPYTLVCKRWRTLLVSIPQLWTTIAIPPTRAITPSTAAMRRYFDPLIRRAGILPLSLSVTTLSPSVLLVLEPGILSRITSLSIINPDGKEPEEETFGFCYLLPNLTHLCYCSGNDGRSSAINLPSSVAPRLTSCSLNAHYLHEFTLPWAQITKLELWLSEGLDPSASSIITQLTNIEDLDLYLGYNYDQERIPGYLNITLPHLRKLTLEPSGLGEDLVFQLLEEAKFPLLEDFTIELHDGYEIFADTLTVTPSRWSSVVKLTLRLDLELEGSHKEADKVLESLWVFENLKEFHWPLMHEPIVTKHIFRYLNRDAHSKGRLFPQLEQLEIKGVYFNSHVLRGLKNFLRRRGRHVNTQGDTKRALKIVTLADYGLSYRYRDNRSIHRFRFNEVISITIIAEELPDGFLEELRSTDCADSDSDTNSDELDSENDGEGSSDEVE